MSTKKTCAVIVVGAHVPHALTTQAYALARRLGLGRTENGLGRTVCTRGGEGDFSRRHVSLFSNSCLLKIRIRATMPVTMTAVVNPAGAESEESRVWKFALISHCMRDTKGHERTKEKIVQGVNATT
jgi:hypothetical protein